MSKAFNHLLKYAAPQVAVFGVSCEGPIAASIQTLAIIGTDFADGPVTLTDDQMSSIY